MADISALEDEIQQLKNQNLLLAQTLNHWKMQCKILEHEKIETMRENNSLIAERNRYRESALRNRQIGLTVETSAKQCLDSVVDASNHIVKIVNLVQERYNDILEVKKSASSPIRQSSAPSTPTSNVNHVRPMIRGVMIKNPIIRVSRTILDPMPRSVPLIDDNSQGEETISPPQDTISSQSPARMRDLCVTLRRVDDITQRLEDVSSEVNHDSRASTLGFEERCRNDVFARSIHQSRSPLLPETQDASNFQIGDRLSDENISGDSRSIYGPTLGCVVEESETETSQLSTNTPQKLNPFIVLNKSVPASPSSLNLSISIADEDPLEGPSWLLDSSPVDYKEKKSDFVALRRKAKVHLDNSISDVELFEESNQVPDSTTNVKDSVVEQLDKSLPSVPQCQSTPYVNENRHNLIKDCSIPLTVEKTLEQNQPTDNVADLRLQCMDNLNAKVVVTKMEECEHPENTEVIKKKQPRGRKKKDSKSNIVPVVIETNVSRETIHNVSNDLVSTRSSSNDSESSRTSENNSTAANMNRRPRRGEQRDYREKALNKKLRRI